MLVYLIVGLIVCIFILSFAANLSSLERIKQRVYNIKAVMNNPKQVRSNFDPADALSLID
jgi:hypothetical protein